MTALIPSLIVVLMVLVLLAPETTQELMLSRIPREARPDPHRMGMSLVPSLGIFVFGFALFQGWDRYLKLATSHLFDPLQARLAIGAGLFFLALGICGCIWPMLFMERFVPQLRNRTANLEPRSAAKAILVGKGFGVILLLASAYILRRGF